MLFKPEHIPMILAGMKTRTFRFWKTPHAKEGAVHKCQTRLFTNKYFAKIRILAVTYTRLGYTTEEEAQREGYPSRAAFLAKVKEINGPNTRLGSWGYAVDFELVGEGSG